MIYLNIGKIPADILKKYAYPYTGIYKKEVLSHSGLGRDCSIIDFGEKVAVLSSDPITASDKNSGYLSVIISCNDLASCGAKPLGILTTILLPKHADEQLFKQIMSDIDKASKYLDIEVLGGHSEVTEAVNKPVISTTALGIADRKSYIETSGAKAGDDVIITKSLGLEGTAILAADHYDYLKNVMPSEMLNNAKNFINEISVVKEGLIAAKNGATAMHDITEGGILGAASEVAESSGKGVVLYKDRIPVRCETRLICDIFKIDPMGLISSGSLLITTNGGHTLLEILKGNGIEASIVGKIVNDPGKRCILDNNKSIPLDTPERDEIYNIKI